MKIRTLFLVGMTLLAIALALFLPAMPQPLAYHDFADKREAYGIENFLDVASNLAFTLAGLAGLVLVLRPRTCFEQPAERWPYLVPSWLICPRHTIQLTSHPLQFRGRLGRL